VGVPVASRFVPVGFGWLCVLLLSSLVVFVCIVWASRSPWMPDGSAFRLRVWLPSAGCTSSLLSRSVAMLCLGFLACLGCLASWSRCRVCFWGVGCPLSLSSLLVWPSLVSVLDWGVGLFGVLLCRSVVLLLGASRAVLLGGVLCVVLVGGVSMFVPSHFRASAGVVVVPSLCSLPCSCRLGPGSSVRWSAARCVSGGLSRFPLPGRPGSFARIALGGTCNLLGGCVSAWRCSRGSFGCSLVWRVRSTRS
jgi:hypothetical protein